jgi:hypothetical protein
VKRIKLIINADDFGANVVVDEEICRFLDDRRVTSTTILANGPHFEGAVAALKNRPHCSVGVHLNVTEFRPLTKCPGLDYITNSSGNFSSDLGGLALSALRPSVRRAIRDEWREQIRAVIASGISVSHLDSHQHVHTFPPLFPVLKQVQRDFGIRRIRITRNEPSGKIGRPKRVAKAAWNFCVRNFVRTTTTQGFCSFVEFLETAAAGCLRYETYEVMVHPGSPQFAQENKSLTESWRDRLPYVFDFISYADI